MLDRVRKDCQTKIIKIFHGKPLIVYTFEALKKSNIFDRIILSTDSQKLNNLAIKHKIDVPFLRPKRR